MDFVLPAGQKQMFNIAWTNRNLFKKMSGVPVSVRVRFNDLLWHLESEEQNSMKRFIACECVFPKRVKVPEMIPTTARCREVGTRSV